MSEAAIRIRNLQKQFGSLPALQGVTLEVPRGSFYALLGPNGAGKSTLLRALIGLIRPDGGEGAVLGAPLGAGYPPRGLKGRIGYVPQQPVLYERMTAGELVAMCRSLHAQWDHGTVNRYLEMFGLPPSRQVRQMSAGMRSQLALTLVMGGRPDLLLLDEPTLGLDPLHRHQYLQVLLADSLEAERTVLLSSHDLAQIERLADRIAILDRGRLLVSAEVDELKLREKRIRVAGAVSAERLLALPGVRRAVREANGWLLLASGEAEALRAAVSQVEGVVGVQVIDQSLEEIFMSYVS